MPREKPIAEPSFGFLSTLESTEYGYFGGYLIVSPLGRPLEFHCTSPVRPSRAQEILYGPTLQTYLLGEQISGALLKAATLTPRLVITDVAGMLVARVNLGCPMALIVSQPTPTGATELLANDDTGHIVAFGAGERKPEAGTGSKLLSVGDYELVLPVGFEAERHAVAEIAAQLSQQVDLSEPFGRIHEAIREAQRIGGRGADTHGQAA
jgi:hypothetical protein